MLYGCIKKGFQSLWRHHRLFLLLWLWTLLLGLLATLPAFQWWSGALDRAPEADRLLEGFSFRILTELTAYDQNSPWQILLGANGLLLLLAVLASPFVAGGTLELVTGNGSGPTIAKFASGGGKYFWRFLRLMIAGGIVMAVTIGLLGTALGSLVSRFSQAGWEATAVLGGMIQAALLMLVAACFTVVLDYARIRLVLENSNRSVRSFLYALQFVFTQAPGALVIALLFGILSGAAWAACFGLNYLSLSSSRLLILAAVAVHQGLMLFRCAMRVSVLTAHTSFYRTKLTPEQQPLIQEPAPATPDLPAERWPDSAATSPAGGSDQETEPQQGSPSADNPL